MHNKWMRVMAIGMVLWLTSPHSDGWAASLKTTNAGAGFLANRRDTATVRANQPTSSNNATLAVELAESITSGAAPADIIVATAKALAQGGLATADLDVTYMPAVAPQASARVDPRSAISMALDSHQRATAGRVTAEELGRMLLEIAGLPADGSAPGELVLGFLSAWATAARDNPDDPQSFAPLFIAEMAKRQDPSIDLLHPSPEDAARLRLSALDLELFTAAFDRAVVDETSPRAAETPTTPCTEFQAFYGKLGSQLVAQGAKWVGGKGINAGLQKIGISPTTASEINTSLKVVRIAAKIWKLLLIYKSGEVTLHIEGGNTVHKRILGEPRQLKKIVARGGISDRDWQEYVSTYKREIDDAKIVRVTRDCLSSFRMPTPANLSDIAQAVENWRVGWSISGSGEHAFISLDVNPFVTVNAPYQMKLTRSGTYSAEAALQLDITQESRPDHTCGQLKTAEVWVKASLYTAEVPGLDVLINAAKGGLGLVSSIADLGAGFIQTMWPPTSAIPLTVEYHTLNGSAASSRGETSGAAEVTQCKKPVQYTGWARSRRSPKGDFEYLNRITAEAHVTFELNPGASDDEREYFNVKEGTLTVIMPPGKEKIACEELSYNGFSLTVPIGRNDGTLFISPLKSTYSGSGETYYPQQVIITDHTGTCQFNAGHKYQTHDLAFPGGSWLNLSSDNDVTSHFSDIRTLAGRYKVGDVTGGDLEWEWELKREE